jgi:hypothetical protein
LTSPALICSSSGCKSSVRSEVSTRYLRQPVIDADSHPELVSNPKRRTLRAARIP